MNWERAISASLFATILTTVSIGVFGGLNTIEELGGILAGPRSGLIARHAVGGIALLSLGVGTGLVYAGLLGSLRGLNSVLKGALFGLAVASVSLAVVPVVTSIMVASRVGDPGDSFTPDQTRGGDSPRPAAATFPLRRSSAVEADRLNAYNPGGARCSPLFGVIALAYHVIHGAALGLIYGNGRDSGKASWSG